MSKNTKKKTATKKTAKPRSSRPKLKLVGVTQPRLVDVTEPQAEHSNEALETMKQTLETLSVASETTKVMQKAFETMSVASGTTKAMQNSFTTTLKSIQEYNGKVVEFTRANTESYVEFVQKLAGMKSPLDLVEIFQSYSRRQLAVLTEQAKELAALVREIAGSISKPLKTGFEAATLLPR